MEFNENILSQLNTTIELFYKNKFIDNQKEHPSSLFRADDNEEFVHVDKGFYVRKNGYLEWPDHLHQLYPYDRLVNLGFKESAS